MAPQIARFLVHAFGESFGQAISQRFEQDRAVVIVRRLEGFGPLLDADTGGNGKTAAIVDAPAVLRSDEIG